MLLPKLVTRWGRKVFLREQIDAYIRTFRTPISLLFVLPDLAEFCGAADPAPSSTDPLIQARAAGRRDVWLHIQAHLNMNEEELYKMLKGMPVIKPEDFK